MFLFLDKDDVAQIFKLKRRRKSFLGLRIHLEKMFLQCWLLLALCLTSGISVPMTVFEKGQFYPNNATGYLMNLDFVTKDECICQCYENRFCLTGSYIEKSQKCSMFSVQLGGGEVRIVFNTFTSVFNFPDKFIKPGKNYTLLCIA